MIICKLLAAVNAQFAHLFATRFSRTFWDTEIERDLKKMNYEYTNRDMCGILFWSNLVGEKAPHIYNTIQQAGFTKFSSTV